MHEGTGLTLEELQHCVNDRCIEAGLLATFKKLLPAREVSHETCHIDKGQTQKWQVCQDFVELNKVTKVPPMPQGDIRTKQQCLSGHRWISTFDFASGFYTCPIPEGQQPYICFYVEGHGYFCYCQIPFGLMGAPSTFADMMAQVLGDLVGILFQLFVNDGGMAGDVFEKKNSKFTHALHKSQRKEVVTLSNQIPFFLQLKQCLQGHESDPPASNPI